MNRIGSQQNLIKEVMKLLGDAVAPTRIHEALDLIEDIRNYDFKNETSVYFYYDDIIDDEMFLTENRDVVDWDAEIVVEIQWSDSEKFKGFWGTVYTK